MQLTEGHGPLLRNGPLSISRRLKWPPNPYQEHGRTHGQTDGQRDGQRENSIPTTNKVCVGYKNNNKKPGGDVLVRHGFVVVDSLLLKLFAEVLFLFV